MHLPIFAMRLSPFPFSSAFARSRCVLLALLLCLASTGTHAQSALTPQDAFEAGIEQAERGAHREAIAFFLIALQGNPEGVGVLWNLGLSSAEIGEHREALKYWQAFRKLRPNEWRAQAKLVQTYQALGDTPKRDAARAALIESYQAAPPQSDLGRTEMFCREQMMVAGRKVLAFEHFVPKGERREFYSFLVVGEDGAQEDYRVTLASDEATTRLAREMGSLPAGKQLYQLDKTQGKNRWTYARYQELQAYEAVRTQALEVISGRATVLSSSSSGPTRP